MLAERAHWRQALFLTSPHPHLPPHPPTSSPSPPLQQQQSVVHAAPHLTPLLPALAIACIALLLPVAVYMGCQSEFDAGVVPWTPAGFGLIARRTYAAFAAAQASGGRVEGKDL